MKKTPALALSVVAFVLAAPLVVAVLFFPVMFLAGPHSDLLPDFAEVGVGYIAWAAVIVVPTWLARLMFRRLRR